MMALSSVPVLALRLPLQLIPLMDLACISFVLPEPSAACQVPAQQVNRFPLAVLNTTSLFVGQDPDGSDPTVLAILVSVAPELSTFPTLIRSPLTADCPNAQAEITIDNKNVFMEVSLEREGKSSNSGRTWKCPYDRRGSW